MLGVEDIPKGKKFDAAEMHFMKRKAEYEKQIRRNRDTIFSLNENVIRLTLENQKLQDENIKTREWIERLLQYTELSENDIKKVCEADKKKEIYLICLLC